MKRDCDYYKRCTDCPNVWIVGMRWAKCEHPDAPKDNKMGWTAKTWGDIPEWCPLEDVTPTAPETSG